MTQLDAYDRQLLNVKCITLGQTFTLAQQLGYDMDIFVDKFMQSETAFIADYPHRSYDGRSPRYLIEDAADLADIPNPGLAPRYNEDMLDWIGWIYRYWNMTRGPSSSDINAFAPFKKMKSCWPYHVMSFDMAIERIVDPYNLLGLP